MKKCKLAASILLIAPGIPFIYQGEEIGMDTIDLRLVGYEDARLKTPMQWTPGKKSGFTPGKPFRNINPNYASYNVKTESNNPDSILNYYKKMIGLRNIYPALSEGSFELVKTDNNKTFGIHKKKRQQYNCNRNKCRTGKAKCYTRFQ